MKVFLHQSCFHFWRKLSCLRFGSLETDSEVSLCVQVCWGGGWGGSSGTTPRGSEGKRTGWREKWGFSVNPMKTSGARMAL